LKKSLVFLFFLYAQTGYSEDILSGCKSNKELFEEKTVLILGGTGYLGRALTSEILKYNPKSIIIFSRDEVKHFNFVQVFNYNAKIKNVIGDIRDYECLLKFTRNVDIVIHAAALKRIDSIEDNVEESIKTNVIGTLNVFNACVFNKVKKVVFISTDKACSPVNTYGACKFVSEKVFTNYDKRDMETVFTVVRYGNVLDSTGSVIPIFLEKIKKGEDITLTHPDMTRFIIDKDEAIGLIFDALRYGVGGEIFIKRLPALKVTDLIHVLKKRFNADNKVTITGIRPGEKIHELLINKSEILRSFSFKDKYVIMPTVKMQFNDSEAIPLYFKKNNPFDKVKSENYSSGNCVITAYELESLFKKLNLF